MSQIYFKFLKTTLKFSSNFPQISFTFPSEICTELPVSADQKGNCKKFDTPLPPPHLSICNFSTKSGHEFSYTLYWKGRTINI